MQRTHRLRADRAWLPRTVRRTGQLVTASTWAAGGAVTAAVAAVSPATLALFWKGFVLGGAGLAVAGERAGNAILRRQIRRMTGGELQLADVGARGEGELVVVRGRIEADEPLRGLLVGTSGVYRRLTFKARGTWIHEAACDFSLLDDKGAHIRILAAGARWMVSARELVTYPTSRFTAPEMPAKIRELATGQDEIEAFEQVLTVGTEVQVVGYKTATPDATGTVTDYRQPPQRATLRSGDDLPLVITAIADLREP